MKIEIYLEREQAEHLSTVLTTLVERLKNQAIHEKDTTIQETLDDAWAFWNPITKQVSNALGFENWCVPCLTTACLTNPTNHPLLKEYLQSPN